jgi:hypothetical protein
VVLWRDFEYIVVDMMGRAKQPLRERLVRAVTACTVVLLGLVLLADNLQSGHAYLYCVAMREVMPHACCAPHVADIDIAQGRNVVAADPDCCQARSVPAFGTWTANERSARVLPAAHPAVVAMWPLVRTRSSATERAWRRVDMQTGPPTAQRLSLLMSFLI